MSVYESKPWLRHYDFWVPPDATFPKQSIYQVLMLAASHFRDRPATAFQGATLTFAEIKRRADRLAAALHARGIRKGDRVGIMLPNCPMYPIAFFAIMRLGAVVVNLNPLYTAPEVENVVRDSGMRILITLDTLADRAASAGLEQILAASLAEYSADGIPEPSPFNAAIAAADPSTLPRVVIDADTGLAALNYTGGTTGMPKGAMLTHANLYANLIQSVLWGGYLTRRGEERLLLVIPYFHAYGFVAGLLLSFWNGTQAILIPKYDVNLLIAAFREYSPTYFPGVPTLFISLLNHPEAATCGLDKVRAFNSGSAPLPVEIIERFEQLSGATLREGYGMTELSCTASSTPALAKRKPGSIGVPTVGTSFKIIDLDTGATEVPIGEEGELCVKGPQVMKGYWNKPEETANALRDGWMHTGDIARMDEDGFFYIVQRKKDMIIVSGFKVFPGEVEEALFTHPAVVEAAVIGVPHAYRGEEVKAYVVTRHAITPEELIDYLKARLAKYKVPTQVEFIAALPKSAVGKVLRRELRTTSETT